MCQNLPIALYISCATAPVALEMSEALLILSDATTKRFTVKAEDLKPYWKSEKMSHFSKWSTKLLFTKFYPTFLNTRTTNETLQQSVKQDSFKYISEKSANMYQIQVYNSSEKSQKYDRTKCLDELISVMYDLVDNLGNYRDIKHFKTSYKRKKKWFLWDMGATQTVKNQGD